MTDKACQTRPWTLLVGAVPSYGGVQTQTNPYGFSTLTSRESASHEGNGFRLIEEALDVSLRTPTGEAALLASEHSAGVLQVLWNRLEPRVKVTFGPQSLQTFIEKTGVSNKSRSAHILFIVEDRT